MLYPNLIRQSEQLKLIWAEATTRKPADETTLKNFDIVQICDEIITLRPEELKLQAILYGGVVRAYARKIDLLYGDAALLKARIDEANRIDNGHEAINQAIQPLQIVNQGITDMDLDNLPEEFYYSNSADDQNQADNNDITIPDKSFLNKVAAVFLDDRIDVSSDEFNEPDEDDLPHNDIPDTSSLSIPSQHDLQSEEQHENEEQHASEEQHENEEQHASEEQLIVPVHRRNRKCLFDKTQKVDDDTYKSWSAGVALNEIKRTRRTAKKCEADWNFRLVVRNHITFPISVPSSVSTNSLADDILKALDMPPIKINPRLSRVQEEPVNAEPIDDPEDLQMDDQDNPVDDPEDVHMDDQDNPVDQHQGDNPPMEAYLLGLHGLDKEMKKQIEWLCMKLRTDFSEFGTINMEDLLQNLTRNQVVTVIYLILLLATKDYVKLEQEDDLEPKKPGNAKLLRGPNM